MITINSNHSAKIAQNNLNNNQLNLQGNMHQLTTGLRINSAADDAAGMQIANRMQTQIQGLDVAQRNAGDAISMAQTAEGAMDESTNVMNRMRDLAMQSVNDTNTESDRDGIQKEVAHLKSEVNRIASTTNFAGINLLDGSASNMTFQIGAGAAETVSFGIDSVMGKDLGTAIQEDQTRANIDSDGNITNNPFQIHLNGEWVEIAERGTSAEAAVESLNKALSAKGIDALAVLNVDLDPVKIEVVGHEEEMEEIRPLDNPKNLNVDSIDVSTQAGAQKAILILDEALPEIDDERANLGAIQNRMESTINNLTNIEENLSTSQSRIMDADFAQQTVEMTSNQMLMQAGTSVLAQAKTMPQYATMLL